MRTPRHTFAVAVATAFAVSGWITVRAQDRDYPGYGPPGAARLTGTYELDRSRSDDPPAIANQAVRNLSPDMRDRAYDGLVNRLNAPQTLSIDQRGDAVTIMSSSGPRTTFDADGRAHTEMGPAGRPITTRAERRGDNVVVSTTGNRGSDFTVQFDPVPGGLRVTRELDSEMLQRSVTAQSYYRRVSEVPRWDVYRDDRDARGGYGPPPPPPERGVYVPDGTQLTARLDRDVSTRTTREGEHFSMTVEDGPYRGASLDGIVQHVTSESGRANMVFDFDRVRMPDGRTGPFEGAIDSVETPDGQIIRVNRSGSVRNDQPTGASGQDTAIGAAVGALIGAIAGGGKGAVVGAVVGGAGTLAVEGRDVLDLPPGTRIRLTVVTPGRLPAPRAR